MIIHPIDQKTEEWILLRKAKMTASNAQAIGNNGKGLDTYVLELMADYYSSGEREEFTNQNIDRGNELEEFARDMYSLETGNEVVQVGFCELDEYTGCSPDGLIGEDGLIEIKCVNDKNHFKLIIDGEIDSKYVWQMQMQMLVTGRTWCHYVSYNPNFERSLVIIKVERDEEKQSKLKEGIEKGKELIKQYIEKFKNATIQTNN